MDDEDTTLAAFVASLQGATDVNTQYGQIEAWAAAGEVATLSRLGALLVPRVASASQQEWGFDEMLRHLEEVLALTPGLEYADTLARLSVGDTMADGNRSAAPSKRLLTHASMLAFAQDAAVLAEVFARHAGDARYDDLFAALAQEMVLQGVDCTEIPSIATRWTALRGIGHPLTWLPLVLTRLETDLPLPSYYSRGSSYPLPFGPSERERDQRDEEQNDEESDEAPRLEPQQPVPSPAATETTTAQGAALCASAVQNWKDESNGQVEVRVYELDPPLDPDQLSVSTLLSLGMDALRDGNQRSVRLIPTTASKALGMLFAAAANGGAYNSGRQGAYGRLAAWRSLAGLVGLSAEATIETVQDAASAATWLILDAATPWFYQVAWDLALVSLSADRRRLSVLAATDTD